MQYPKDPVHPEIPENRTRKRSLAVKKLGLIQSLIASTMLLTMLSIVAPQAQAAVVTPADAPHVTSPAFGPLAPGGLIDDEYLGLGIRFSTITPTGIFSDGDVDAWGGVNGSGNVDLIADVTGRFELPGNVLAQTSLISVEAGHSFVGDLLLSVFDVNGNLLGSTLNDDGFGPHGRTLLTLSIPGIHSFIVSTPTGDGWGVDQIEFNDLTPAAAPVPEPTTMALLGSGALGLVAKLRRRKTEGEAVEA
jgi:hypothetical protein